MPPALITAVVTAWGAGRLHHREVDDFHRWIAPHVDAVHLAGEVVDTPIVLHLDVRERVLGSFWEAMPGYIAPLLSREVDAVHLRPVRADFGFDSMAQLEMMASEFPERFRPDGAGRAVLTRADVDTSGPVRTLRVLNASERLIRTSPRPRPVDIAAPPSDRATIFVMVASYRDPDLWATIDDALSSAESPDRLRFGVCVQDRERPPARYSDHPQIGLDVVDPAESDGVGWARSRAQSFYAGEDFTLQIDSHTRFEPDWDTTLIEMLRAIDSARPILTTYPAKYHPDTPIDRTQPPNATVFKHFIDWGCVEYAPRRLDADELTAGPIPARHFSAGFAFAPGRFVVDVPYDPEIYFIGEEVTMAARAFTHGYDLFHPTRTIAYHHYARHGSPTHWGDLIASRPDPDRYDRLRSRSHQRVRSLLGIDGTPGRPLGRYGLGSERTLREFEVYCGIDFRRRLVERYAASGRPPPDPRWSPTERALERRPFVTRIDVTDALASGTRRWRVTLTDAAGVGRAELEVSTADIAGVLLSGRPELAVPYSSYRPGTAWELELLDHTGATVAAESGAVIPGAGESAVWA